MESEESIVITALSVDEAIILGLTRLGVTREQVEIEVLDEGSRGFLGLGTREARVRLSRRAKAPESPLPIAEPEPEPETISQPEPEPEVAEESAAPPVVPETVPADVQPEPAATAPSVEAAPAEDATKEAVEAVAEAAPQPRPQKSKKPEEGLDRDLVKQTSEEVAKNVLGDMQLQTSMSWKDEDRPTLWISLEGPDSNTLVGPRAQTLDAVQYLFRSLVHHRVAGNYNLVVDADGYRRRRRRNLEALALRKAEQAVESGRTIRLRPMPAHERRMIHITLRKDSRVETESVGKGSDRAVTIIPRK